MPGFRALSDQVFVREAERTAVARKSTDAETVIIYGWGDAWPQHILKYAEGYRELFPAAKQVMVLTSTANAIRWRMRRCSDKMQAIVDTVFAEASPSQRVLVHVMSGVGAVLFAATLQAHMWTKATLLPHQLVVFDSSPVKTDIVYKTFRISRAIAISKYKPSTTWYHVLQNYYTVATLLHVIAERGLGAENIWDSGTRILNDPNLADSQARRLYLYSKQDTVILRRDVEQQIVEAASRGCKTDRVLFDGSDHVSHARLFPKQYWAAVLRAWQQTGQGARL
ncbi:hypothetical protein CDD82_6308 [Ophiocordyceps australis]|uniref:AB hydrolase-1 domain-containing protein n=1 Tax=Ophiocordyceps australis TaxID=1399860 RepID=A0A2C5ZSC4_9HYPO|nr:hypothetical protein CDD82_6308 [Ophiocordyceps australis]